MKKLILSTFIIGSFGLYVIWQGQNGTSTTFVAQPVVTQKNNPAYTPDQTYVATTPSEPAKTTQKTTTKKTSTGVVTTTPITPPLVIKRKACTLTAHTPAALQTHTTETSKSKLSSVVANSQM